MSLVGPNNILSSFIGPICKSIETYEDKYIPELTYDIAFIKHLRTFQSDSHPQHCE